MRSDLAGLIHIYNHYVRTTHITFDIHEFTEEQRIPWFEGFSEHGPHRLLVAEVSNRVTGYASSQAFRPKPAYARSVETTIYIEHSASGRGIGRRLYEALLEALGAEETVHRAYAGIALPNPRSVKFHEEFGFHRVGTFREVGFKMDRYWDVSWYERDTSTPTLNGRADPLRESG